MKSFVTFFFISVASSAKLDNTYLPPNSAKEAGGNENSLHIPTAEYGAPINTQDEQKYTIASVENHHQPAVEPVFKNTANSPIPTVSSPKQYFQPSPVYGAPHQDNHQRSSLEARANILRFDNNNDGNGNYHFDVETENGIHHEEHGQLKQVGDGEVVVVQGSFSYIGDDGRTYTVTYIADENGFQPTGDHIDEAIARTASEAAKSSIPDTHQERYNNDNEREHQQGGYQY